MERKRIYWIWTRIGYFLTSGTLVLLPTASIAQITFERTYGGNSDDEGNSVLETTDGGYIITGSTRSLGAGSNDVYLIKANSIGDTLWTKTYGGSSNDQGFSVQQTLDGGYILAGRTNSFGAGLEDVYLIKTDSSGDTLWTKTYGGSDEDVGISVQETEDGGYILTGYTESFGSGLRDVYLIRTDSNGNTLWTRTYGGTGYDYGFSVQQTLDVGYILAGRTNSFGAGMDDVYLIKTDSSGDTLWTKTYGGTVNDGGSSIQQTTDGGYIIAGYTLSFGEGLYDFYLIKINAGGDTLWTKTYGGNDHDWGTSIHQTTDGGYILTGYTESFGSGLRDVYLIKTDPTGETLWTRTFGGTRYDVGLSVQEISDGGYVITGGTTSFGAGLADVYLIKTDGNGMVGVEEKDDFRLNPELDSGEDLKIKLLQIQPNPFSSSTLIRYTLPEVGAYGNTPVQGSGMSGEEKIPVSLAIYDITGRLVETLVNEPKKPGVYRLPISNHQLPGSGIYFVKLSQIPSYGQVLEDSHRSQFTETRRLVFFR